jgi:hypothetical protein
MSDPTVVILSSKRKWKARLDTCYGKCRIDFSTQIDPRHRPCLYRPIPVHDVPPWIRRSATNMLRGAIVRTRHWWDGLSDGGTKWRVPY